MNKQIAPTSSTMLPAAMSVGLERRVAVALNRIDDGGHGPSIAAEDALTGEDRGALERRQHRLVACLQPAGEQAALVALGEMQLMMLDAGLSEQEADKALDLWVKNLADLPSFAIQAATKDFLRGDAGDRGFVPKLPVFRQHVLLKLRALADEKSRVGKVIEAHKHIRLPRASAERRAEIARAAVSGLQDMQDAGEQAECERRGLTWTPPKRRSDPHADLASLMDRRLEPVAPLSFEAQRIFEDDPAHAGEQSHAESR